MSAIASSEMHCESYHEQLSDGDYCLSANVRGLIECHPTNILQVFVLVVHSGIKCYPRDQVSSA
jgi:hypothetical protein